MVTKSKKSVKDLQKKVLTNFDKKHIGVAGLITFILMAPALFGLFNTPFFNRFAPLFAAAGTFYFMGLLLFIMVRSIRSLLQAKNFSTLFLWYLFFTFAFLFSMTFIHSTVDRFDLGELHSPEENSLNAFHPIGDYFYFSAITYFAVGYGEIYPTGIHRLVAVVNAFVGHLFNLIIVAMAVGNFMHTQNK